MGTSSQLQLEAISYRRLGWVTLLAAGGAAFANSLIFLLGEATGAIPKDFVFSTSNQPLSLGLVASFSFVGVGVGGAILAGLARFSRRPLRAFRLISVVFLVLFALAPFSLGAPLSLVLVLELMHLVAGAIAVSLLTTLTRRSQGEMYQK
jgi:hypothetical protein